MVRFIIFSARIASPRSSKFTFQYGQIYYRFFSRVRRRVAMIYIPIWLDLLCADNDNFFNAVSIYIPIWLDLLFDFRFLINIEESIFTFQYGQIYYRRRRRRRRIYIPIWLDLLYSMFQSKLPFCFNLHSNMVRFIIKTTKRK